MWIQHTYGGELLTHARRYKRSRRHGKVFKQAKSSHWYTFSLHSMWEVITKLVASYFHLLHFCDVRYLILIYISSIHIYTPYLLEAFLFCRTCCQRVCCCRPLLFVWWKLRWWGVQPWESTPAMNSWDRQYGWKGLVQIPQEIRDLIYTEVLRRRKHDLVDPGPTLDTPVPFLWPRDRLSPLGHAGLLPASKEITADRVDESLQGIKSSAYGKQYVEASWLAALRQAVQNNRSIRRYLGSMRQSDDAFMGIFVQLESRIAIDGGKYWCDCRIRWRNTMCTSTEILNSLPSHTPVWSRQTQSLGRHRVQSKCY